MSKSEDIEKLTQNWREAYERHLRPTQNEYLVEDLEEEIDQLNIALHASFKRGIITKQEYQSCMAIAWEQVTILREHIQEHEEEEEYIARLTGAQ